MRSWLADDLAVVPMTQRPIGAMLADMAAGLCSRPISQDDATALIGVLAVLQGRVLAHQLDDEMAAGLSSRVGADDGDAELGAALDNLDQRLRYGLGEYDETPVPR